MNDTQGPPAGQGIRPPLRLVRLLAPSGPTKYRRRRPVFTRTQAEWIRTALRNARRSFGTWACLADAMGIGKHAVESTANGAFVSAEMAIRLAFATGMSLDALLRPGVGDAGRCSTCGAVRGAS